MQSWLNTLPFVPETAASVKEHLLTLFDDYVPEGLKFLRESCKENVPSEDSNLVAGLCSLFKAMFSAEKGIDFGAEAQMLTAIANPIFVFSYVWTIGGNVAHTSQDAFDEFSRRLFDTLITIPPSGLIYDYYVNYEDRMFHSWEEQVPRFLYSRDIPYFQMIVPTADTIKYTFILETLIRANKPVLLTGLTGMQYVSFKHTNTCLQVWVSRSLLVTCYSASARRIMGVVAHLNKVKPPQAMLARTQSKLYQRVLQKRIFLTCLLMQKIQNRYSHHPLLHPPNDYLGGPQVGFPTHLNDFLSSNIKCSNSTNY